MRGLLAAIGFLTRLPVPVQVFDDADAQARSLAWYPVVGLLIGALLAVLAWALRDSRVTSVLIGASSVAQLEANVDAVANLEFAPDVLAEIEKHAVESGINLWHRSSSV